MSRRRAGREGRNRPRGSERTSGKADLESRAQSRGDVRGGGRGRCTCAAAGGRGFRGREAVARAGPSPGPHLGRAGGPRRGRAVPPGRRSPRRPQVLGPRGLAGSGHVGGVAAAGRAWCPRPAGGALPGRWLCRVDGGSPGREAGPAATFPAAALTCGPRTCRGRSRATSAEGETFKRFPPSWKTPRTRTAAVASKLGSQPCGKSPRTGASPLLKKFLPEGGT